VPVRWAANKYLRIIVMDASQITSKLFWNATFVTIIIDILLILIIMRLVSPELFKNIKWFLSVSAFFVYAIIWLIFGSYMFWDVAYRLIFPSWSRWLLPLGFGFLYGLLALAFWYISKYIGRWQSVCFVILGGFMSLVGHSVGISRGLFQIPLLANASAVSMLTFGIFEFVFYWCAIIYLSLFINRLVQFIYHRSKAIP
jgi:hypothetical protein